ncbi:TPA: hypothetical protein DHW62_02215 [candidate division WWE3 bacterium]|uniref:Uncharacterized protein n=1 Tax=candidate division WWE3 bacterium TaxID=2053526 RepID=A0A656PMC8_UNCKA|nr:hypothetical protein P147_WWE3C00001G0760 [candidate division WWE3 bacterium RAAC2_WWE3_1]KKS29176.1 MAG: hypothetical protein UU91_C0008G0040 [candidate division WWE3 bacterium GW2011_GWB1_42_117]KKT05198.1 MAG: hypothetical protein UV83_C0006G0027 [candidate division WWE3 bacterium GW2011_GWE2_43_18]KKT06465.1 MAG: hypothetical protein UV84_C0007G0027 [candidate division WWE3 bacterium GW2011_GWF2_43_18]KKT26826.1 MAG: hypothetical protein UW13_C0008G0040 [candidate division WWE3 bacterium
MMLFNVKVFQPHFATRDHEPEIRFLEKSNSIIEAGTASEAFLTVMGSLSRINDPVRKLLEKEFGEEFVGKKGYRVSVVEMVHNEQKVWEIPSKGDTRFVG